MSTNLYYRRVEPKKARILGTGLKWAIEKRYGYGPVTFTTADVLFLEGVRAACPQSDCEMAKDATTLIAAIEDSPSGVEVWVAE